MGAVAKVQPAICLVVKDILLAMDLNLLRALEEKDPKELLGLQWEYAGFGIALDILRKRLAGSSGDPASTRDWADSFSQRTE